MRWVKYRIAERREGTEGYLDKFKDWFVLERNFGRTPFPEQEARIAYAGFYHEGAVSDLWGGDLRESYWFHHYCHARDRFLNLWISRDRRAVFDPFLQTTIPASEIYQFYYGDEAMCEFVDFLDASSFRQG